MNPRDDKDLIDALMRDGASEVPPPALDRVIKQAARDAVRKKPRRWMLPLASAAAISLTVLLVINNRHLALPSPQSAESVLLEEAPKRAARKADAAPAPMARGEIKGSKEEEESSEARPTQESPGRVSSQTQPEPAMPAPAAVEADSEVLADRFTTDALGGSLAGLNHPAPSKPAESAVEEEMQATPAEPLQESRQRMADASDDDAATMKLKDNAAAVPATTTTDKRRDQLNQLIEHKPTQEDLTHWLTALQAQEDETLYWQTINDRLRLWLAKGQDARAQRLFELLQQRHPQLTDETLHSWLDAQAPERAENNH